MTLAITTAGLAVILGFQLITWIFFAITMSLTITSRLLYHGRKGPKEIK